MGCTPYSSGRQVFGRIVDGCTDACIGSATADIARHGSIDISIAGSAIAAEQRGGTHDLPTLAIAALSHVVAHPCILNSLAHLVCGLRFDGGDLLPCAAETGVMHDRMAWPFRCTVQAPHMAMPQPNLVPVMPSVSRKVQRMGVEGSTSADTGLPLRVNLTGMGCFLSCFSTRKLPRELVGVARSRGSVRQSMQKKKPSNLSMLLSFT